MEGHSADRILLKKKAPPEGNRSTYIKERAFTDAAAATGLDTKKAVDRVKASMPSRARKTAGQSPGNKKKEEEWNALEKD